MSDTEPNETQPVPPGAPDLERERQGEPDSPVKESPAEPSDPSAGDSKDAEDNEAQGR